MSRSWGHLTFLSSFTNNTTKTANETFQPLRGIFSIQRTHELIGCRLQSLWCVQVQLSDREAGDWRGHISCPLSLLVEVNVEHLSPNIKFRNWIISDGHTCRRCSVTHAFRFIQLLRIKHAVTQEREAVPLLLPFSFTSFLSSIRFGNRQIRSFKWSLRRWNVHTYKSVCTFSQPVSPESRTL